MNHSDEVNHDEIDWTKPFVLSNRTPKIKRNAPCPCGSKKRAKHCCHKYDPRDKKTKAGVN